MKNKLITTIITLTAIALASPSYAKKSAAKPAAEKAKPTEPAKPADKSADEKPAEAKPIPYMAKVASVDAAAKTFTTKNKDGKENVFTVTDKTQITKGDAPATFEDIKANEIVRGTRVKTGEAKWDAVKVMIGPKEASPKGKKGAAEAKPAASKTPDAASEEKK
jgi:hypothetical protein